MIARTCGMEEAMPVDNKGAANSAKSISPPPSVSNTSNHLLNSVLSAGLKSEPVIAPLLNNQRLAVISRSCSLNPRSTLSCHVRLSCLACFIFKRLVTLI